MKKVQGRNEIDDDEGRSNGEFCILKEKILLPAGDVAMSPPVMGLQSWVGGKV